MLIADDNASVRSALAEWLEADPALEVVGLAGDAEEAVEVARASSPRVALVDVRMPKGGGTVATRGLVALPEAPRVIGISASEDREEVIEMLRAGAIGYVVKGGSMDELLTAIHRADHGEATLSPPAASHVIGAVVEAEGPGGNGVDREAITQRIRDVIDGSQVAIAFQPIVELERRALLGYEALARFPEHADDGPAEWFADANQVGLGAELERAAIEAAFEQVAEADGSDHALDAAFLSVNASPGVVGMPELRRLLGERLDHPLVIEVTEHASVEDYLGLRLSLDKIKTVRPVSLAIDDVGAGYASLRHVLQMSPELLKLDLSMTHDIDTDRTRRAMVAGLIAFAEQTETAVIAEGIETASELDALRELGIVYGQGYHLGRPGPLGSHEIESTISRAEQPLC